MSTTKSSSSFQTFSEFLANGLNDAQRKAATKLSGPLLVIAGAGSGKTRVITSRIINLLVHHGVSGASIVALTFTNKAAREMQERLAPFLEHAFSRPFVGTFHSYCLHLLRRLYAKLGRAPFSLLDDEDQQHLVHTLIKELNLERRVKTGQARFLLSQAAEALLLNRETFILDDPALIQLFHAYRGEKKRLRVLDFDDLLIEACNLLSEHPELRAELQFQLQHILIDEYQDTNRVQHFLIKLLALKDGLVHSYSIKSLCAVGDEDQSIYSWRGATIENIRNFVTDFPETEIVTIDQNYRSPNEILAAANALIHHNGSRHRKKLWSEKESPDRLRIVQYVSHYQEAEATSAFIKASIVIKPGRSCAIIYRAHHQSRIIEEMLLKEGISYKIVGGTQFYERKEIKDILAYLRVLENPADQLSFFRIINTPTRGIGAKAIDELHELFKTIPDASWSTVLRTAIDAPETTRIKREAYADFIRLMDEARTAGTPAQQCSFIIEQTQYKKYLSESYEPHEARSRSENVAELLRALDHAYSRGVTHLQQFLDEVALLQEAYDAKNQEDAVVQLMTVHGAKGLEFDIVAVVGVEEGLLPSTHSLYAPEAVEEERRLLYVAITRACEYLKISFARSRVTYGSLVEQIASRFINELRSETHHVFDLRESSRAERFTFFSQWLSGTKSKPIAKQLPSSPPRYSTHKLTASTSTSTKNSIPASTPPSLPAGSFRPGIRVSHSVFGTGTIERIETKGSHKYVTVKFARGGIKIIQDKFLTQA